jgi:uncharacterized membrane protein YqiK
VISDIATTLILVIAFVLIVLIFLGIFFGYLHAPATAKAVDTGMIVSNNGYYIAIYIR